MPSDEELIERMVKRDAAAFNLLLERHTPAVTLRLRTLVRDAAAADDLAQDVFLRLWTHGWQWRRSGTLEAWLVRVATNLALNHMRGEQRRRQRPLELPAERAEDEAAATPSWLEDLSALRPDQLAQQADQVELVKRLIGDLPSEKQQVMRMVRQEEKGIREVAQELGLSEGTVKSRLHYASKMLQRQIGEMEDIE